MNWFKKEFDKLRGGEIHLMCEILNTKCKSLKEGSVGVEIPLLY